MSAHLQVTVEILISNIDGHQLKRRSSLYAREPLVQKLLCILSASHFYHCKLHHALSTRAKMLPGVVTSMKGLERSIIHQSPVWLNNIFVISNPTPAKKRTSRTSFWWIKSEKNTFHSFTYHFTYLTLNTCCIQFQRQGLPELSSPFALCLENSHQSMPGI